MPKPALTTSQIFSMYVDAYNILQSNLCTSPSGLHGPSRPFSLWLLMLPVFLLCSLCETEVPSERQHVSSMSSETAQKDYLGGAEKNENWRETMLMWERREYDRGFVLERLARRWILEGHAEKNVLHCLIKQRKELQKRHLQGWTDRAKVGSVIPSSILGVCGASLLRPNRANLPWMLRIPVTIAVVRTDFLGGFYSQWVKVYAQIWYLTADHECERQVGSITSSRYWSQWTERNILALSFLLSADMGQ